MSSGTCLIVHFSPVSFSLCAPDETLEFETRFSIVFPVRTSTLKSSHWDIVTNLIPHYTVRIPVMVKVMTMPLSGIDHVIETHTVLSNAMQCLGINAVYMLCWKVLAVTH